MDKRHSSGQARLQCFERSDCGQVLLITLLVLVVALTAGLSLVARTVTDISISEKESASSKAFEAAEAGVEEALQAIEAGRSVPGSLSLAPGGEGAEVSIGVSEPTGELANREIYSGEATTFWLNSFLLNGEDFPNSDITYSSNNVKICWSGSDNIETAIYYYQSGEGKVERRYLLGGSDSDCSGLSLDKGVTVSSLPGGASDRNKFINVRFYGNADETITVAMIGTDLPRQGNLITSGAAVGDVARKITVFQGWPVPPSFFDFALFSGGSLSK